MANKFTKEARQLATVDTLIPSNAVTSFEKLVLAKHGFLFSIKASKAKGEGLKSYFLFYAEDNIIEDSCQILALKQSIFEYASSGDVLARDMAEAISNMQLKHISNEEMEVEFAALFPWHRVFQHILQKSSCNDLEDILVTGISFTPNGNPAIPFDPGETKGWIYRITRHGVYSDSLMASYHRIKMEQESDFYQSLRIVLDLVKPISQTGRRTTLSQKQTTAIQNITEYLSWHQLSES